MSIVKIIIYMAFFVFLIGCGGGGGEDTTSSTTTTSTTLNGTSSDGYIRGAKVCLDLNLNAICDVDERYAYSDVNGKFSFSDVSSFLVSVISSNGYDTAIAKDFVGNLKRVISVDTSLNSTSFNINPLSDLVATYFLNSIDKSLTNLDSIEQNIANTLGMGIDDINANPMTNRETFIWSQKIQQIKLVIERTGENLDEIEKALSEVIIDSTSSYIDISEVYKRLNSNISNDEITFIQNYIDDLSTNLSNISNDITLFPKYQMLIDDATYHTFLKIDDNNFTSNVIVDLSDSRVNSALPIVANPIPDVLVDVDTKTKTIDLTDVFTDSDNDDSAITKIVLSNSNEKLVKATISGNILSLDINTSVYGSATITIRATSDGLSVNDTFIVSSSDTDNDFIPDNIEDYLGMDSTNADEDGDGVIDGLESSTSSISDQFFDKQWHIRSLGTQVNPYEASLTIAGNDLNLTDLYHYYMGFNNGDPIVIQIVDTGVESNHEDLKDNMDLTLSRDSKNEVMGDPVETGTHGTMCAGIAAARAFNGKGVRGVAPFAKIAGSNWLGYQTFSELEEVWCNNDPKGKIAISSNSWGTLVADDETFYEELMQYASENLRIVNGVARGKLFLKAAGNYREKGYDAGLSYAASNPYVITVAGLKNDNTYASYSSPGSNLFISGYSGEYYYNSPTIGTTIVSGTEDDSLPSWDEDINNNYTYAMNGTSSATPMVAGALALVLEACPDLGWRDVKYLMAKNAIKIDSSNPTWVTNGAGFHHSVDYGFGLINTQAMIKECKGDYNPLPSSTSFVESFDPADIAIPDNNTTGISYTFNVTGNKTIEWIGVTVYSDHTYGGDLEIYLTSPSGTKTRLMLGNNSGENYSLANGFRYGSVAFYGEESAGNWTIQIADIAANNTGSFESLDFNVTGY